MAPHSVSSFTGASARGAASLRREERRRVSASSGVRARSAAGAAEAAGETGTWTAVAGAAAAWMEDGAPLLRRPLRRGSSVGGSTSSSESSVGAESGMDRIIPSRVRESSDEGTGRDDRLDIQQAELERQISALEVNYSPKAHFQQHIIIGYMDLQLIRTYHVYLAHYREIRYSKLEGIQKCIDNPSI